MTRIWISRKSSIPVREQLSAQLIYAILGRRLEPGERLPSVRELARRLKIHPNTVSAAYQDLGTRGWVQSRSGSGVFVSDIGHEHRIDGIAAFVSDWVTEAARRGFTVDELICELRNSRFGGSASPQSHSLLVVHPDADLACILAAEISDVLKYPVAHCGVAQFAPRPDERVLTTAGAVGAISTVSDHELIQLKSIEEMLAGFSRPSAPVLIGIVSRSQSIRNWSSLLLPALGLQGSDLIQRNPDDPKWMDGLAACDLIAADVVAARDLPRRSDVIVLRLVADAFLRRLQPPIPTETLA